MLLKFLWTHHSHYHPPNNSTKLSVVTEEIHAQIDRPTCTHAHTFTLTILAKTLLLLLWQSRVKYCYFYIMNRFLRKKINVLFFLKFQYFALQHSSQLLQQTVLKCSRPVLRYSRLVLSCHWKRYFLGHCSLLLMVVSPFHSENN